MLLITWQLGFYLVNRASTKISSVSNYKVFFRIMHISE